jgi:hypothetical protein
MSDANQSGSATTPTGGGAAGSTVVPDTPSNTPGWYPDPDDTNAEIYWNGSRFHGRRKNDPASPASWWEWVKRVARLKWLWIAFGTSVPVIAAVVAAWMAQLSAAEQAQKAFAQTQEQAQKAFAQSQERDAYIAFYNAVDEFVEAVWAEERRWEPGDTGATVKRLAAPMRENLGTSMNNVLTAESKVTFYGSQETQKAANDVVEQVGDIQGTLQHFEIENPQYPDLTDDQAAEFRKLTFEIRTVIADKLQSAHLAFRRAARADLGLPRADGDIYNPLYSPGPRTPMASPAPPPPLVGAKVPAYGPFAPHFAPTPSEPPR